MQWKGFFTVSPFQPKYMKNVILYLAFLFSMQNVSAQLKTTVRCPPLSVDLLYGKVNELYAKSTIEQIKSSLPCFSEVVEDPSGIKCAGVFYKDLDIIFYTDRNYIEIGKNFKGKLNLPLIGASRSSMFNWLGYPKLKDIDWDAYQMSYGTLILYFNKSGKLNKMQISTERTETIKLCE